MAVNPSVSITNSISVYPKVFIDSPKTLVLSNLDRQCPNLMYMVFFYRSSHQDLSFDSVFGQLKAGLEANLSIWYPAAGRLSLSCPDHVGKLNIWCNNAGATLVRAMARAKISELGDLSCYNDFFEKLVFKPVISNGNFAQMPLVVAQVTKFDCGGYSIGIGTTHSLFDGIAAYDFLLAWASQSQGRPLPHKPVHERGALLLDQDTDSTSNFSSNHSNPTAIDHLYQLIRQANPTDPNQETSLVFRTFHLSAEMIENLKKKVDRELCCSTFEVLAAHLWKVRTKALGLEKKRKVCLQFSVDARNRMVPPLPKGFSGNGYVLASLVSTAGEVEEQSHEHVINRINKTKNRVNHDYVKAYIRALQGPPEASLPPLPELTLVSDWTRVPFHKIDFLGGEAAYASPLLPPIPQVAFFMQNPNDRKAIDVRIGLLPSIEAEFSHRFINMI